MIAKYKKNILVRRLITILAVVASALLQTYVIQAFYTAGQPSVQRIYRCGYPH